MNEIQNTDPKSLARVLDLTGEADSVVFSTSEASGESELRSMFAHQLDAPLAVELKLASAQQATEPTPKTFRELFEHAHPPVWILEETKSFAKQARANPDPSVQKIATALYYVSVMVALTKSRKRITDLTNDQLAKAVTWLGEQKWLDSSTRELGKRTRELIGTADGS